MKTAYIHLSDHQDPIWNKAFTQHMEEPDGDVIRSYSEREELQFDRWLDILPDTGATLEVQQACTFREYLRRNPERLDTLRRLIKVGQIEFLGGGEAIIDYNVVIGESIYRNLLHGCRWMTRTAGAPPRVGCADDTFGLSAQVPQIFAQFGFHWLPLYSRMFGFDTEGMETEHVRDHPARPFWRGLDGTLICIKREFADQGVPSRRTFVNYQYRVCPECRGQGCRFCDYSGLDCHVLHGADSLDAALAELAGSPSETMQIHCTTEETIKHPSFLADAVARGKHYGVDVRFDSRGEHMAEWAGPYLEKLAAGTVAEEEIDIRAEGNPIATGCYTTRSILKRENRALEHLLLAAERFAVMAAPLGMAYPTQALADLWRTLSLTQAHDALTGNHPDGTFLEMRTLQRTLRRGAGKRLLDACRRIAAHIDAPIPEGAVGAAVFNPLTWSVERLVADVVIPDDALPAPDEEREVIGWTAATLAGAPLTVLSHKLVTIAPVTVHRLQCVVTDLPPCGYTTIVCRPVFGDAAAAQPTDPRTTNKDAETAGLQAGEQVTMRTAEGAGAWTPVTGNAIENDRYRIAWGERGVTEIFDKALGKVVAGPGTSDLWAEDDIGSFWETLKHFDKRVNLHEIADVSIQAYAHPNKTVKTVVIRGALPEPMVWDLPDSWTQPVLNNRGTKIRDLPSDEVEVLIDALRWEIELRLVEGDNMIGIRATIDCDSQNIRLRLPFMLNFTTPDDRAWYEIPYGMLERPSYRPAKSTHCAPDGSWPAVHWAAAVNPDEDYTCAVLNRGVPACRFVNGVMDLTLLRSPRLRVWSHRPLELNRLTDPDAKDAGTQVVDLAFTSGSGNVADNRLVHRGYEFNTDPTAVVLTEPTVAQIRSRVPKQTRLGPTHSFYADATNNVITAAIKQAEDAADIVVRMSEVYGRPAAVTLPPALADASEVNPLEDNARPVGTEVTFAPFQIKTLRCPGRASGATAE